MKLELHLNLEMTNQPTSYINTKTSRLFFIFCAAISIFWMINWDKELYTCGAIGIMFDFTIMLVTISLPLVALVALFFKGFNVKSFYFYSLILIMLSLLLIKIVSL